jgi:hypothetical protein
MTAQGGTIDFFSNRPRLLLATLVVMFAAAIAIRLMQLDRPGVLVDRDYTSAMFARAWFFEHRSDVPEWRREMSAKLVAKQPVLEPPVTEWLASLFYRVVGREDMRLGRLLTVFFWLVGGVLLFLLARRLVGADAGVLALAYYLFLPLAVLLSRSFQADALMMMLFIASLLAIVRHHQAPDRSTLAIAALLSAITLVYRPLVMPALVAVFALPAIQAHGWRRGLLSRASLVYLTVATIPAFAYYGYGAFIARYFQWKLTSSFMFSLYGHYEFWREWFLVATSELGVTALVLAFIGVVFVPRGLARTVLVALGLGYLCFGLAFTYHIHTHGYYQAQLIPAVAIAAAPLTLQLIQRSLRAPERWVRLAPIMAGCLVAGSWWIDIREDLSRAQFESPQVAMTIGELVNHSDRVVFLSPFYGLPLQYLGEFTGAYWQRPITYWLYRPKGERERSIPERLATIGFVPEYFVITHFREYATNHEDLRQYLETDCTAVAITDAYHIYARCVGPSDQDAMPGAPPGAPREPKTQ